MKTYDITLTREDGTKQHWRGLEGKAARDHVFKLQREQSNAHIEMKPSRK
jgi:hypothetical protein